MPNGYHCGEKMRWEKGTLWEQSDYVPLLVRTPGGPAAQSTRTVGLVDIFPTLAEYCGLGKTDHSLDGSSLVPLLKSPQADWDRPSLSIYGKGNASVRDERYRYILYADGAQELYDRAADPFEWTNIVARVEMKPVVARLEKFIPTSWGKSWGGRWETASGGKLPPEPR